MLNIIRNNDTRPHCESVGIGCAASESNFQFGACGSAKGRGAINHARLNCHLHDTRVAGSCPVHPYRGQSRCLCQSQLRLLGPVVISCGWSSLHTLIVIRQYTSPDELCIVKLALETNSMVKLIL
jgi:hypothetical protein